MITIRMRLVLRERIRKKLRFVMDKLIWEIVFMADNKSLQVENN